MTVYRIGMGYHMVAKKEIKLETLAVYRSYLISFCSPTREVRMGTKMTSFDRHFVPQVLCSSVGGHFLHNYSFSDIENPELCS
jgi:hypothetical protein